MSGWGFHWTPCKGSGGGGGTAWAVLAVVLVAALVAAPVAHVVSAVGRVVAEALTVALYVLASVVGVAVLAGVGLGVRWVVRWQAGRAVSRPAPELAVPSWPDRPALGTAAPQAIEAPKVITVTAGMMARAGTRRNDGTAR